MFIYSAKMDKKKLATILICVAVVVLVLILLFTQGDDNPPQTYDELVQEQIKLIKKTKLETNEDRLYLLTTLGWEVEISRGVPEVQIPEEFSEVYENYNKIQKTMGLDLSKYKGEKVMRYTYKVMNHPSGEKDVRQRCLCTKTSLSEEISARSGLTGLCRTF